MCLLIAACLLVSHLDDQKPKHALIFYHLDVIKKIYRGKLFTICCITAPDCSLEIYRSLNSRTNSRNSNLDIDSVTLTCLLLSGLTCWWQIYTQSLCTLLHDIDMAYGTLQQWTLKISFVSCINVSNYNITWFSNALTGKMLSI